MSDAPQLHRAIDRELLTKEVLYGYGFSMRVRIDRYPPHCVLMRGSLVESSAKAVVHETLSIHQQKKALCQQAIKRPACGSSLLSRRSRWRKRRPEGKRRYTSAM
jgi:hypothetical protein